MKEDFDKAVSVWNKFYASEFHVFEHDGVLYAWREMTFKKKVEGIDFHNDEEIREFIKLLEEALT